LSTHQILIRSLLIAGRASKKPGIASLKSFGGSADPTGQIIGSLTVNREVAKDASGMAPNILNLSYRGQERDECASILNAIIESYKDFLDETYRNVSDDTLELITKARDVLQEDYGPNHPQVQSVRRRIALMRKLLTRSRGWTSPRRRWSTVNSVRRLLCSGRNQRGRGAGGCGS
jgi:hypothetical protein